MDKNSTFRTWDKAETEEKRKYVANLIANAAGTTVCSDDVVRLFVDWLNTYHEVHFAVIREVLGGVIRQDRDTDWQGRFVRKPKPAHRSPAPTTMKSAFDDEENYVLTELGKQFVHYTMNEVVQRLGESE